MQHRSPFRRPRQRRSRNATWKRIPPTYRVLVALAITVALPARRYLRAPADNDHSRGRIYLVGMGPGDSELVTFKAARVLKEADAVYCFDYLKDEVARYVPQTSSW